MFNIGDNVVYPMHGAGTIISVEEKEILGELKQYFILKMPIGHIKISIPIDKINDMGIREVIDSSQGATVLKALEGGSTEMSSNWNQRYRDNLEKIRSGDIFEIAEVVRNLSAMELDKSLSTREKKMLNSARRMIASELVIIGSMTVEEAESLIDESIG